MNTSEYLFFLLGNPWYSLSLNLQNHRNRFYIASPHVGQFLVYQLILDWQNNSKTKFAKTFFFIFMPSYAEMSFWNPKKLKKSH
jgi:hypothetical protein